METINLSSTQAIIYLAIFGAVVGLVLGLVALLLAVKRGKKSLGLTAIPVCTVLGAIMPILGVIAFIIFLVFILRKGDAAGEVPPSDSIDS